MLLEHQILRTVEVGDGAGNPSDAVIATTGEKLGLELLAQSQSCIGVQRRHLIEVRRRNVGVEHADALEALPSGGSHTRGD